VASASGPKNSARMGTGISNPLRVFCFGSPERTSDFFFRPAIEFSPSAAVISRACDNERRGRDSNPRDDGKGSTHHRLPGPGMQIVRAWSASAWSRPFRPLRHALHSYSAPTGVLDSSSEATGFFCNRRQITPEIEEMEKVMEIDRRVYRDGVPVDKCPHYSGRLMAYWRLGWFQERDDGTPAQTEHAPRASRGLRVIPGGKR